MAKSVSTPTFEVRFVGEGISPDKITIRTFSDALSAVQDLASGRDPFEQPQIDPKKSISLAQVRSGSAVYACVSHAPKEARTNLSRIGSLLTSLDGNGASDDEGLIAALRPIESLSDIARKIKCQIEVFFGERRQSPVFVIQDNAFQKISDKILLHGDTTVIGTVLRAGGATEMRCFLRVPGRRKGLYCSVETRDLVRRLGQSLYQPIVAKGSAVWIHRTWRIYRFKIKDFSQPKLGNPKTAIEQLRSAGLDAWDKIPNPEAFIREFR